jgi:hypothetical protein
MSTVTRLTTASDIRAAREEFEKNVTKEVYDRDFSAIGQGFNVQLLIGPLKKNIYVKCVKEEKVTGLAYGHPIDESKFFIDDIISAAGSQSGSAMVAWFGNKENVGMPSMRTLALDAANAELRVTYAKSWYGFTLLNEQSARMEKAIA